MDIKKNSKPVEDFYVLDLSIFVTALKHFIFLPYTQQLYMPN